MLRASTINNPKDELNHLHHMKQIQMEEWTVWLPIPDCRAISFPLPVELVLSLFLNSSLCALFSSRLEARKEGNDALSYVYKILMNSLYGRFGINPATVTSSALALFWLPLPLVPGPSSLREGTEGDDIRSRIGERSFGSVAPDTWQPILCSIRSPMPAPPPIDQARKPRVVALFAGFHYWVGLSGMPRRIPDYPDAYAGWNALSSSGSYISVVGICRFFVVVAITSSSGNNKRCAPSPWAVEQNPTTPEWMVQSPPAFHTFGELPAIKETKSSVK
ncbi:cytochrome c oxidase subunit 1 [Tanacetum coccineum]